MKELGLNEIRQKFLDFFESKGHYVEGSFPLVPQEDKSLLLINAGMAPLKPYFTGVKKPPKTRMATCQKCIRTADIDNVGHTARHATFFEMLGNFSFGDYFKRESIKWGWEFLTEVLEIPENKLYPSVYEEDDDAFAIWRDEMNISPDRIVKLGKEDNFWEIGVGPCGPCSEIYYDNGETKGCKSPDCKPGCDCDRFIEVWNHVFTQFERQESGEYTTLSQKNIDTGMGLERLACVMQNVDNIFEVDTIRRILNEVCRISNKEYGVDYDIDVSIRIITDHIRAVTFLISDGVMPNNEGRGYVLRRLLRRAARHGKKLGVEGLFLTKLVNVVIEVSSSAYPDLVDKQSYIEKILTVEEERFAQTIDQGLSILNDWIRELNDGLKDVEKSDTTLILSGQKAFKLYDTYGFPIDLTREILSEYSIDVDEEGFEIQMSQQRTRARDARRARGSEAWADDVFASISPDELTEFVGYTELETSAHVRALASLDEQISFAKQGDSIRIILDKTPFYAESGGQIGDCGTFYNDKCQIDITNTQKGIYGNFIHTAKVISGQIGVGDTIIAKVDSKRRFDIARNHTATHLVHKVLRDVLGDHVHQAGSLVGAERMRFDITHFQPISKEEIEQVETLVNKYILDSYKVNTDIMSLKDAQNAGAMALFGEKYGDEVRVVDIIGVSKELCGGTHVSDTSHIGLFKIISETGVAAGVRRIEVVTGRFANDYVNKIEKELNNICELYKIPHLEAFDKVSQREVEIKSLQKEIQALKEKLASQNMDSMIDSKKKIGSFEVICESLKDVDSSSLRTLGDNLKNQLDCGIVVLASIVDGKVLFLAMATDNAVKVGIHAGKLISEISKIAGGGGGGRPNMAQAGGKDSSKVDLALQRAIEIIKEQGGYDE